MPSYTIEVVSRSWMRENDRVYDSDFSDLFTVVHAVRDENGSSFAEEAWICGREIPLQVLS
jgi:hypothetical protein